MIVCLNQFLTWPKIKVKMLTHRGVRNSILLTRSLDLSFLVEISDFSRLTSSVFVSGFSLNQQSQWKEYSNFVSLEGIIRLSPTDLRGQKTFWSTKVSSQTNVSWIVLTDVRPNQTRRPWITFYDQVWLP